MDLRGASRRCILPRNLVRNDMAHRFTRAELYKLVWSEPMRSLAKRFEVSDVGLAKACQRYDIPRPGRGYWAKLKAGKAVQQAPLPRRGPGLQG